VAEKRIPKPAWWKNTYFWIAMICVIVGIVGLVVGDNSIRDPGQIDEPGLGWIYLLGAAVMLVNGLISHNHTVRAYREQEGSK
jgi:hypothetical protein